MAESPDELVDFLLHGIKRIVMKRALHRDFERLETVPIAAGREIYHWHPCYHWRTFIFVILPGGGSWHTGLRISEGKEVKIDSEQVEFISRVISRVIEKINISKRHATRVTKYRWEEGHRRNGKGGKRIDQKDLKEI